MGSITCFMRDGDRAFLIYSTSGRGNEPDNGSFGLLDRTPYGRREAWEGNPAGWPGGRSSGWFWRSDADGNLHLGPDQPPRAAVEPPRCAPRGDPGRHGHHH
jgi:hypothetical protein